VAGAPKNNRPQRLFPNATILIASGEGQLGGWLRGLICQEHGTLVEWMEEMIRMALAGNFELYARSRPIT